MVKTQEEFLSLILERVEDNPDKDVDEVIAEVYKEMGLKQEALDTYKESAKVIDSYTENLSNLRKSKREECLTGKEWFMRKFKKETANLKPEERKKLADDVVKSMGNELMDNLDNAQDLGQEEMNSEEALNRQTNKKKDYELAK